MDAKACKHCRRLFNSESGLSVCPNCYLKHEEMFKIVKKYIRSHENATVFEVSEACDMEIEQIKQWIKEERIEYTQNSKVGIECEKCGVLIKTGRLCLACKIGTVNTLKSAYVKKETEATSTKTDTEARMRFLRNDKDERNE